MHLDEMWPKGEYQSDNETKTRTGVFPRAPEFRSLSHPRFRLFQYVSACFTGFNLFQYIRGTCNIPIGQKRCSLHGACRSSSVSMGSYSKSVTPLTKT